MPSPTFRAAGPADVPTVLELVESAYRGRGGWTNEADLIDGARTSAAEVWEGLDALVVGEEDGEVAVCFQLRHDRDAAWLGMLAVRPALQGRGFGRAAVEEAERRAAGCRELRMTVVNQRPDLLAWYGRLGFAPTGEVESWPYGDDRFGRPRRPDLAFVVLARRLPATTS